MSAKNLDRHGRLRSKIISFRVSPEEGEMIDRKVALAGTTKQDYILSSVLDKTITALPSPFVIFNIRKELRRFIEIYGTDISADNQELINWTIDLIQRFDGIEKAKADAAEEPRQ